MPDRNIDIGKLVIERNVYVGLKKKMTWDMKSYQKSGNSFIKHKSTDFSLKFGHGMVGASRYLQYEIDKLKIKIRAYNIVIAFLKNKKFSDIEKYYYNSSFQKMLHILINNNEEYSRYYLKKSNQLKALDEARILLGSFKLEKTVLYNYGNKKEILIKKSLPVDDFDQWLNNTGNLY